MDVEVAPGEKRLDLQELPESPQTPASKESTRPEGK
jgi:hypothetical protein